MNQHLIELSKSILKDIPVDDNFLKKIKKLNERLEKILNDYVYIFEPRLSESKEKITDFRDDGMKNVNEDDDDIIYDMVENMEALNEENNNLINCLQSTPRGGQGRKKYNIDTTEYIIPSKYL